MNFIRTEIEDVVIVEPKVHGDERGYFVETFRQDKLEEFIVPDKKVRFPESFSLIILFFSTMSPLS